MKMLKLRPVTGHFIVVWKHNNKVWSTTQRWNENTNRLEEYNHEMESWFLINEDSFNHTDKHKIRYIQL